MVAQTILKELRELRGSTEESAAKINKKIDNLSGELNKLKQDVRDAKEEAATAQEEVQDLREEVEQLRSKVDQLEGQSRRENLIFHGIPGDKDEDWKTSETKVRNIITNKLGLDGDEISMERAHRLKSKGQSAPIIVKFSFFSDRSQVLGAAKKTKRYCYLN